MRRPTSVGLRASALALALAIGCGNNTRFNTGTALTRPGEVEFACFDVRDDRLLPPPCCDPALPTDPEDEDAEFDPALDDLCNPDAETLFESFAMHAIIAQTATGEVGAVQVDGEELGVRDTDPRVPGFTFIAVGEAPSALITPTGPLRECTFVLNRGSGDLTVMTTASLRAVDDRIIQGIAGDAFAGARPGALALDTAEETLWVSLPALGAVAALSLADAPGEGCEGVIVDGSLRTVTLASADAENLPDPVDLRTLEPDATADPIYTCPADLVLADPPALAPRTPVLLGDAARPAGFAVDRERSWLWVADSLLPLLHRIDLATGEEILPPINVGTPTRALALTPPLPATFDPNDPLTERYLYAIDETDGSVMAIDVSDPARASFGAVLAVDVRGTAPADRLPIQVATRDLEIVTPGYDATASPPGVECVPTDRDLTSAAENGPPFMQGVFLAVGGVDGRVRFVDVLDLDTTCRGTFGCLAEEDLGNVDDAIVTIRRHRPRLFERDESFSLSADPSWETGAGSSGSVLDDGSPSGVSAFAPTLTAFDSCPGSLSSLFPETGSPLLCGQLDPWGARPDSYSIEWDGAIPFSASGGTIVAQGDGTFRVAVPRNPCELGVLGAEDVPATGYLADNGYGGDSIAVSELPSCVALLFEGQDDELLRMPILQAFGTSDEAGFEGELVLGAPFDITSTGVDPADIEACLASGARFSIAVENAFRVSSGVEGMLHRVRTGGSGRCEIDPDVDPQYLGRAFFETPYRSPVLAFTLGEAPDSVVRPELQLRISSVPGPITLLISEPDDPASGATVESLLTTLRYNADDERLYSIEQDRRGLIVSELTPLGTSTEAIRGRGTVAKIFR